MSDFDLLDGYPLAIRRAAQAANTDSSEFRLHNLFHLAEAGLNHLATVVAARSGTALRERLTMGDTLAAIARAGATDVFQPSITKKYADLPASVLVQRIAQRLSSVSAQNPLASSIEDLIDTPSPDLPPKISYLDAWRAVVQVRNHITHISSLPEWVPRHLQSAIFELLTAPAVVRTFRDRTIGEMRQATSGHGDRLIALEFAISGTAGLTKVTVDRGVAEPWIRGGWRPEPGAEAVFAAGTRDTWTPFGPVLPRREAAIARPARTWPPTSTPEASSLVGRNLTRRSRNQTGLRPDPAGTPRPCTPPRATAPGPRV